ncbi:protein gp37 [Paraburkholderia terricola]|jgi:protein gp37|uniref:Phage protein Gp37/Gp68 n=1 Tax=Paraburkholderia terricola TaxID=169427 RepID=A0A1M6SLD5_9BURK|nr:protein gp37 [Paraburkholderia terricola]SDO65740.1 Phage protein Gp37/Gp68 [Paraburkholderia sediminicola]SHK45398.1 Phage protein Gp37/Gp68 [Paraburkholderia terricola]
MSENSKIAWIDHTFDPWEGCQEVGPGCDHRYAQTHNARFSDGTAAGVLAAPHVGSEPAQTAAVVQTGFCSRSGSEMQRQ